MINKKSRMAKIMLLVMIVSVFALLSSNADALGVVPAHKDVTFEPGKEERIKMKLTKQTGEEMEILLYAEGPLEGNVFFDDSLIVLAADETERIIEYTFVIPEQTGKKGVIETKIVAKQVPKKKEGSTIINAGVAVVSKLRLLVPFTGKYAEAKLVVPIFKKDISTNFAVEVKNLGTEDIISAQAVIDIFGPLNNKLVTVRSDQHIIRSKEKMVIEVPWKPELQSGTYQAKLTLIYDENNAFDEKVFNIGTRKPSIDDITVDNFRLGGIAKFEILVSNDWNLPLDELFADVQVMDPEGTVYTQSRTATIAVPEFGKGVLEAFWDTEAVAPGPYKFKIVLNALGDEIEEVFDILVELDKITANLAGRVVAVPTIEEEGEDGTLKKTVFILSAVVILLVIFNGYIYFKKIRKPPSDNKISPIQ